jgi:hypothetical protein
VPALPVGTERIAALGFVQQGQVVEPQGNIGMVRAKRLLIDRQRALVEKAQHPHSGLGCSTANPER